MTTKKKSKERLRRQYANKLRRVGQVSVTAERYAKLKEAAANLGVSPDKLATMIVEAHLDASEAPLLN